MAEEFGALFGLTLLIEDEPAHALLIKRSLGDTVGNIQTASTMSEAKRFLGSSKPDLVITDLNLPDSSGTAHIKELVSICSSCPIIVLTSSTSLNQAVEAMKLGAKDFVVKNFGDNFSEVMHIAISRIFASERLEQEKRKLQKETELLRESIERENDGFAIVEAGGSVVYANKAFNSFGDSCQWDHKSFLSLWTDVFKNGETLKAQALEKLAQLSPGGVWHTEIAFVEQQNGVFDLSVSAVSHLGEDTTRPDCFVIWVKDISELKRRERLQKEILSTTTHDLKGPLGAISISSELLSDILPKNEKSYQLATRIGSSAQMAINLIEEFLSARRIEEGALVLRPGMHVLSDLIDQVVSDFSTVALAKNIQISLELSVSGDTVMVDKLGFIRVLGNLLSNAIKFTPSGGKVAIYSSTLDSEFLVEVQDSGPGMEASEVQKVFERFGRLEKHKNVAGTGIGLFVVKSIVSAHGGRVDVTSQVGKGTRFTLRFPSNPPVNESGEIFCIS